MTQHSLSGQVFLISGGAGEIGAATAARLVAAGAEVVLGDIDAAALAAQTNALGGSATGVVLDVTDPASCVAAVEFALRTHGRLDVIWANAGVSAFGPVELMDPASWRRVIEVNLLGAYNLIQAALPHIIAAQGYVAFTASGASFAHSPGHSAYAASKAGLEALGNALRTELAEHGVRVGVFHPLWIRSAMVAEKQDNNDAFNILMAALPRLVRTLPEVDVTSDALIRAFTRRSERMIFPQTGWLLYALRPLLPLRPFTAGTRKAAPKMRRAFEAQTVVDPNTALGLPKRYT